MRSKITIEQYQNNKLFRCTDVPVNVARKTKAPATNKLTTKIASRIFSQSTIAAAKQNLGPKISYLKTPRILESPCWNDPCEDSIKGLPMLFI